MEETESQSAPAPAPSEGAGDGESRPVLEPSPNEGQTGEPEGTESAVPAVSRLKRETENQSVPAPASPAGAGESNSALETGASETQTAEPEVTESPQPPTPGSKEDIESQCTPALASPAGAGDGGIGPVLETDTSEIQTSELGDTDPPVPAAPRLRGLRNLVWGAGLGVRLSMVFTTPIAAVAIGAAFGISFGLGFSENIPSLLWLVWGCFKRCAAIAFVCAILGALFGWAFKEIAARLRPPVEPIRPYRTLKAWSWIGGVALALMTVAFMAGAYLGWRVERHLNAVIAEADRTDPFWRLDDLMANRDEVPDEENSAFVVNEVASMLPENWPNSPSQTDDRSVQSELNVEEAFGRIVDTEDYRRLDDETTETLRAELEIYREAVEIARSLADFDRGRHELELGPTLIDTLLPETQATRSVARLLQVDSALSTQYGNFDDALDSCRAIFAVARSIGDEPTIISQLVRISADVGAMMAVRRALAQGEPSDNALVQMQDLVFDELHQPLIEYALRGERAINVEVIRRVSSGEMPITALSDATQAFDPSSGRRDILAPWGTLMFTKQLAVQLEWLNDLLAIAERPASERMKGIKAWKVRIDQTKGTWIGIASSTLPLLMSPAQSIFFLAHFRLQAELGATVILLAAERHRQATGEWPASVADIDPDILPDPPLDPFSGEAYRMEHVDGRLRIYSIGPNLVDEHGAYDQRRWGRGTTDDDVGANGWDVDLRRQPADPSIAAPG